MAATAVRLARLAVRPPKPVEVVGEVADLGHVRGRDSFPELLPFIHGSNSDTRSDRSCRDPRARGASFRQHPMGQVRNAADSARRQVVWGESTEPARLACYQSRDGDEPRGPEAAGGPHAWFLCAAYWLRESLLQC
jgi:hypothetical protein